MPRWRTASLVAFVLLVAVAVVSARGPRHQARSTPPPVAATFAPYAPAPGGPAVHGCGVERWAVKTGTDAAARDIDARPRVSTVAALRDLPAPANPTTRVPPVETTVYEVKAILTDYKVESDGDEHLVLLDPGGGATMVAEIPAPSCVGTASAFAEAIAMARTAFDARYRATSAFQQTSVAVTVTGVGFFDRVHGQRGVARNGIELHPVLSIALG